MFVEDGQGSLLLADGDKFLGPFENILRFEVRRGRHVGWCELYLQLR